ncbi:MAG: rhodanese-like domain-containing protein [Cyclobacteriaceae bacterium]
MKVRSSYIIPAILIVGIFLNSCKNSSTIISEFDNAQALVEDTKTRINEITLEEFRSKMDAGDMFVLIDVRTESEHDAGYIPGSVLIPRGKLEFNISNEAFWEEEGMYTPLKDDVLILYCRGGNRSALAAESLQRLGFSNVYSIDGGFTAWKTAYPENIEVNLPPPVPSGQPMITVEEEGGAC